MGVKNKTKVSLYKYEFPSRFGSHSSMIVKDDKGIEKTCENLVVLKDENGEYSTERKYLDTGLVDPNRAFGRVLLKILSE